MTRWEDLGPDPRLVAALDTADYGSPGGQRPTADDARNPKKRWSELFATACATMLADAFRAHSIFEGKTIRPREDGSGQENFTPLGRGRGKRIDVVVAGELTGLEVGVSLKSLNFPNAKGYHDHNLTGRLYELRDEVSLVHEYLPRAYMAAVFFVPIGAVSDKVDAPSSFARAVAKLRQRTGRLDPELAGHAYKCDSSAVALYCAGVPEERYERGVVRYFDTSFDPPRQGRPQVSEGLDLNEWVDALVSEVEQLADAELDWSDPEPDPAGSP